MEIKLNNNKKLVYEIEDSRSISITHTNFYTVELTSTTGDIQSVSFDNNYTVSVGDKINVEISSPKSDSEYKSVYKVSKIYLEKDKYILEEEPFYESNYFALPSVITNKPNSFGIKTYFMNCYFNCSLDKWKDKEGILYLKYRFSPFSGFINVNEFLVKQPNFIDKFDFDGHIIYAFKILSKYKKDVELYNCNSHNNLSEEYRNKIVDIFSLNDKQKLYKQLLKKEEYRLEQSIFFAFEIPESWNLFNKPIIPKL